jgi:hypothetical protein
MYIHTYTYVETWLEDSSRLVHLSINYGANPTITSYNGNVVKIYNATNS